MKLLGLWSVMLVIVVVHGFKKFSSLQTHQNEEATLYKLLLDNYDDWNPDRVLRPIYNVSETQHVLFGLAVIRTLRFDEGTNIATFQTWERYLWRDISLQWDPDEFGGIDQMRIPIDKIWKPDIILYNGYTPSDIIVDEALAVVSYDGTVLYIPVVYRNIPCDKISSVLLYCPFKYGSWAVDVFKLDLDFYDGLQEVDLSEFISSNDFKIVSNKGQKNVKYYPCCPDPYSDLTFSLEFKI